MQHNKITELDSALSQKQKNKRLVRIFESRVS